MYCGARGATLDGLRLLFPRHLTSCLRITPFRRPALRTSYAKSTSAAAGGVVRVLADVGQDNTFRMQDPDAVLPPCACGSAGARRRLASVSRM